MSKPQLISLGEVLWDFFPDGERFGGAPANFACHSAIQGASVTMLSAIGDDQHGRDAIRILDDYGIDTSLIQIIPNAPTGSVGIDLDANRKPTFTIHQGSAWDQLAFNEAIASRIATADAVYFGTLGQRGEISRATIRRAIDVAADAEIPRVLDINLRPPFYNADLIRDSIQRASILKLSDDELHDVCSACEITEDREVETMLRRLLEFGDLEMVVMTRGANGALLVNSEDTIDQDGIATTVIDTVGAGDSFTAAFLIGLLGGKPHRENLRNACRVAAETCSHLGAVPPSETSS